MTMVARTTGGLMLTYSALYTAHFIFDTLYDAQLTGSESSTGMPHTTSESGAGSPDPQQQRSGQRRRPGRSAGGSTGCAGLPDPQEQHRRLAPVLE